MLLFFEYIPKLNIKVMYKFYLNIQMSVKILPN